MWRIALVFVILLLCFGQSRLYGSEFVSDKWQDNIPVEAHVLYEAATSLFNEEKYTEATEKLSESIKLMPNYRHALYNLGIAYGRRAVTVRSPSYSGSDDDLYHSLFFLQEAARYGDDAELQYELGWNSMMRFIFKPRDKATRTALLAEAENAFKKSLAFDPQLTKSMLGLGVIEEIRGNYPQALAYYIQAEYLGDARGTKRIEALLMILNNKQPSLEHTPE